MELTAKLEARAARGTARGAGAVFANATASVAVRHRRRSRAWVLAPAAALAALLVGGIPLLLTADAPPTTLVPIDTSVPPPTTLPPVVPTTTEPTTTTTSEALPPPEPIEWASSEIGPGTPRTVIAGGPGLIAGGTLDKQAAIWVSTDGLTWEHISLAATLADDEAPSEITDIAAGPDGYVAVGGIRQIATVGPRGAAVWTSPDGLAWTRVALPDSVAADGYHGLEHVTRGPAGFVAVGMQADLDTPLQLGEWYVLHSPDGATWRRADLSMLNIGYMWNLIATDTGYLGVGVNWLEARSAIPGVWTSTDGMTWSAAGPENVELWDSGSGIQWLQAVTRLPDGSYLATGNTMEDLRTWASVDGVTWSIVSEEPIPPVGGADIEVDLLVPVGDRVLLVGGLYSLSETKRVALWESADGGRTWELLPGPDAVIDDLLELDDGRLLAVGTRDGAGTALLGEWNKERDE